MRPSPLVPALAAVWFAQEAPKPVEPVFEKRQLSDVFFCEGASFGDFDRDGNGDIVSGPYWYTGPDFAKRHELAEPKSFDPLAYSDNFFAFPYDFDRDGWLDVFFIGFPGERAWWARNPGDSAKVGTERWVQHTVFANVDNEAPTFTDVNGDRLPDLVCLNGGRFGYATFDPMEPQKTWTFHPISPNVGLERFTHGLGVGDLNGDGKPEVIERTGWWEQPSSLQGDPLWKRHEFVFSQGHGGAQMLVDDVDGDGDGDVISSLNGHGWGLSWFEQVAKDGAPTFVEHRLMNEPQEKLAGDVCFSELHALELADIDGDGKRDFVTGKRYWAHGPTGSPGAGDPAVLYWWKLRRDWEPGTEFAERSGKATFEPHLIDDDSGVGVQVVAGDVNGDGWADVVVGNKKGTFVHLNPAVETLESKINQLLQKKKQEQEEAIRKKREADGDGAPTPGPQVPRPMPSDPRDPHPGRAGGELPRGPDGQPLNTDFETGDLRGWTVEEGDAFVGQPIRGDSPTRRQREKSLHQGDFWIGGYELAFDVPHGELISAPFEVTKRWASFLVGGGSHQETAVELVREGEPQAFFRCTGANYESMQPIVVDLKGELGRKIRIRLIDGESGGWGHLNFDDFRLHAEKPAVTRPQDVPEILEPDLVLHAGLSPEDAARAMTVPDGFRVDVIAAEPDVVQPIALAIDAKGRLWVAQAIGYPIRQKDGEGKDSILVFEDKDGDSKFETRTVFAERVNLISGLEPGFGGLFVGIAPQLVFFPDANDDLVPDGPPEVLLDGFGWEDTHETLNAFHWGPDGWLYGCHGVFTHSRVGRPGTPDAERIRMNAAIWRYHPQRRDFEIFAEGTSNPWGVDFDDFGEAFCSACVIPHLYHAIPGARYIRQAGRHFEPYTYVELDTIADHRHYAGGEPYVAIGRSGRVGGGHAHCGALLYLGDQFPDEYRNTLLMGNIHGNRVNRDVFERNGATFVGKHGPDFIVSNDKWFRHVGSELAPDGSLFFIDWYDSHACHSTPAELWNRGNGRIYRVSYGEAKARRADVAAMSPEQLVAAQLEKNDWWVRQARIELQKRGAERVPSAVAALADLAVKHADPTRRLRGLWALHSLGRIDEPFALVRLFDRDEHVRGWTIRLLCEKGDVSAEALQRIQELTGDPSPIVRREIASGVQRLPLEKRWSLVAALAKDRSGAQDPVLPKLYWYALEPLVGADPKRAMSVIFPSAMGELQTLMVRRAAAEPRCHDALVFGLSQAFGRSDFSDANRRAELLGAMHESLSEQRGLKPPQGWSGLFAVSALSPESMRPALQIAIDFGDRTALERLRTIAASRDEELEWRRQALAAVVQLQDTAAPLLLRDLVSRTDDGELRGDAIRALASFDDAETPGALLAAYPKLAADEKHDALTTLASRPPYAKELLLALGKGTIPRADLPATVVRRLRELANPEVDALVKQHFGVVRDTPEDKAKRIAELKSQLTPDALAHADKSNGRALFAASCMKCHVLFGAGRQLAPEITGANRADLDYLLVNVVDPNAVIGKDYQVTNLILKDGRIVSGVLQQENASALTVVSENETTVVARADVDKVKPSTVSLMPEGQLDTLKPEEIRDLFAYLQSPVQVPMKATAQSIPYFFTGKDLAFWSGEPSHWSVEDGAIVGRSEKGLAHNSFLVSDLLLADFRLTFEVRLVRDEGNSGIQFRSVPLAGDLATREVKGYQADVGPGWWGKLYEEAGRALLSDVSGEAFVRKDDWNLYEIVCTGSRVRTSLNGHVTTDVDDPSGARSGQIALQIHSGGPTEVRFRKFELELDPKPLPPVAPKSTKSPGSARSGQ